MNQCASWHYGVIVCLLLLGCYALSQEKEYDSFSATVFCDNTVNAEKIRALFDGSYHLERVTFYSDSYLSQDEFVYITDLVPGVQIDAELLIQALTDLGKKNKYSSIRIAACFSDQGVKIHFIFRSFWTFKKVKIHRVFQGRTLFSQCYVMNRGDVFNPSKHSYSIIKIKELLEQDGYYASEVTSRLEYDQQTKEVTVHISIFKAKRFRCGAMSVEIISDDASDYEELQKSILSRLSRKLSLQKYKKDHLNREAASLKKYLSRKGFLQTAVELEEKRNKELYTVDLKWKITVHHKRSLIFFGNRFFSKTELLEKILVFGNSAWLMPASLLAEEILSAYKRKGFWDAQVSHQEEKDRSFFVIQENARAIVTSLEIKGACAIDPLVIKKRCFKKILKHKYYDFQLYDEATKMLTPLYINAGFLSFSLVNHTFVPLEQEHEYKLVVTIDEGKQSHIVSVTIDGYPELQQKGPFNKDFSNQKVLFDSKIIDEQRTWLVNHFQKLGYVHPRIKPNITMQEHEIAIVWVVESGEIAHFGKTIIVGSTTFPFKAMMKLLCYRQGEHWDQEKIRQTFKAFKALDMFEAINIAPDYTDKDREKSVLLKVHSDDSYELRTRAGFELQHVRKYQTFNGLTYKIGGTGLVRNPFNKGDIARLDLDFARSHREVIARYARPLFLKAPIMWNMQVYSISYDQPGFIGSINDIYTLQQNGLCCEIEKKTTYFEGGVRIGFEGMVTKIKDAELQKSLITAIDFQPQLVGQMVPFFFIEPTVMFERLDNALNPTKGFLTLYSLKSMIPLQKKYKNTLFVKVMCEQSVFVPLGVVVFAARLRFGHIFYRKLSAIMPSERFYLGGSHSLRGYEADLAPPLGVFVDEDMKEHLVPRGGKSMCNINAELRFPLYKKLSGVIFQDFGILNGDTFDDFKPQNFLAATGFGTRFATPLGPLRFDIGWRWKKQTSLERSLAWFLTFGQAF